MSSKSLGVYLFYNFLGTPVMCQTSMVNFPAFQDLFSSGLGNRICILTEHVGSEGNRTHIWIEHIGPGCNRTHIWIECVGLADTYGRTFWHQKLWLFLWTGEWRTINLPNSAQAGSGTQIFLPCSSSESSSSVVHREESISFLGTFYCQHALVSDVHSWLYSFKSTRNAVNY